MGTLRRAIQRAGQAALCISALAGGAELARSAHTGASAAAPDYGVFPPPMPPKPPMPPHTLTLGEPHIELARTEPEPAPHDPFARSLRDGMVMTGRTPHRLILFTFDDGPDPRNTPRLLDTLDEVGVKAVFFLTASRIADGGPWQRRNQEIAREIVRRGHTVGNHTLDHAQLPLLDDEHALAAVTDADAIFEDVLGERTWLLRPPGGARSARVDALLAERGYTQVLWNLGSGDFQVRSADDVVRVWQRVLEVRERDEGDRGGIVLMHDTHEWSVEAFPRIVSWLREQNCALLARGEELYDIVDDPSLFFASRGGADPSVEAPPASPSQAILDRRQRDLRVETARRCERLAQR